MSRLTPVTPQARRVFAFTAADGRRIGAPSRLFILAWVILLVAPLATFAADASSTQPLHISPDLSELAQMPRMMLVIVQIAAILAAAKLLGWLCESIKVPGVIGELLAGAIIGPFLLGSLISIPVHGDWIPLFPRPTSPGQWPVNDVIWGMSQFASIILLFITGLHTDLKQFLRYVGPATLVAVVGLILPMALGVATVYIPFFSDLARHDAGQPVLVPALFVGAILAATSIGITARVLSDINKLDTPEGVTIIGAAVLDDVLGIIALAIVVGIHQAGSVSLGAVGMIGVRAIGFWIALTLLVVVLDRRIERFLMHVKYAGALVGLALALVFVASGAAEAFGLAFIIGAYSVGLGLSRRNIAHKLMDELRPINDFMVPIFFASLGMLVNFHAMLSDWRVVVFGLVVTAVAIVGKLGGCGVAAFLSGFTLRGSYRVGLGMMPRGEVALIVAGIGLSKGVIQEDVFGVSIMMTLITTLLAPIMLIPAFARGGSGRKGAPETASRLPCTPSLPSIVMRIPYDLGELILNRLLDKAREAGWVTSLDGAAEEVHLLRSDGDAAMVRRTDEELIVSATDARHNEFLTMLADVHHSLVREISAAAARQGPSPTSSCS